MRSTLMLAFIVLVAPVQAQETLEARLQMRLDSIHRAGSFPGATLGVALRDGRTIALAVGQADTARDLPMSPAARMLQGSVGKTYVAAVALKLAREGKLELDAKVSRYLGDASWFSQLPNARDITVRMLMNHTSGIERYEFKQAVTDLITSEPDHVWTPEERVSYVLGDSAPFAAGAGWEYSDTNYILVGMIVERITRRPLYDVIRAQLLDPLGLHNTIPSDRRQLPGVVQGYAGPDNAFGGSDAMIVDGRFIINPQLEWAGGGFASTTEDLARWARALWGGEVLDSVALAWHLEGVPARLGQNTRYGLGVILRETSFGPARGHSGFFPGYLTEVMFFPDPGFAIALQVNTSVSSTLGAPLTRILLDLAGVVAAYSTAGDAAYAWHGESELREKLRSELSSKHIL
jgi:D-alanyl-D-alanine carboxypeptidase